MRASQSSSASSLYQRRSSANGSKVARSDGVTRSPGASRKLEPWRSASLRLTPSTTLAFALVGASTPRPNADAQSTELLWYAELSAGYQMRAGLFAPPPHAQHMSAAVKSSSSRLPPPRAMSSRGDA